MICRRLHQTSTVTRHGSRPRPRSTWSPAALRMRTIVTLLLPLPLSPVTSSPARCLASTSTVCMPLCGNLLSYPGQLSLAIPPWVGAMSTSECWGVNRHTARCIIPVSVVLQRKLVSGRGLRKPRSAGPCGPYMAGGTLRFTPWLFGKYNFCNNHLL